MLTRPRPLLLLLIALAAMLTLLLQQAEPARAQSSVVTDCSNDSQLRTALTGLAAGTVTFDCGSTPPPIVLSVPLPTINGTVEIDGGEVVTLSGGNATRILNVASAGHLTLKNITLTLGLSAGDGGAITVASAGRLTIQGSVLRGNRSTGASGGAILTLGTTVITDSVFENNIALNGGAIYPRFENAVVTIERTTFRNNQATGPAPNAGWGGALLIWENANVFIDDSLFEGNVANYTGMALYFFANSQGTVEQTTFQDHITYGSIIYSEAPLLVRQSLFRNNAGSILSDDGATLQVQNSTFSGPGGVATIDGASAQIVHSTFVGPGSSTAFFAGVGSTLSLRNTIVTGYARSCFDGGDPIISLGYNISIDSTCFANSGTDRVTDPLLQFYAFWGGPTASYLLKPNSPAVDGGVCVPGITLDQRGQARPFGAACDVGAVEWQRHTVTVNRVGSGRVVAETVGIDCGAVCSVVVNDSVLVELVAIPAAGNRFVGWSDGPCKQRTTCLLVANTAQSVTATFAPIGGPAPIPMPNKLFLPTVRKSG